MKNTLTKLYDLKDEYEKIYQEYELMLMDDKSGKNLLFAFIVQQMAELRLAIRIIDNEIQKEMEEE